MNERFDRDSAQKALAAADNLRQLLAAFQRQVKDIAATQKKILAEIRRLYPGAATEEIGSMEFRAAEIPPEAFDREDAYAMTDRKPDYRDVPPEPLDDGDRKALKQEVHKAGWDELQPEKQATQDKEPEAGDVEEDYSQELKAPFPLR